MGMSGVDRNYLDWGTNRSTHVLCLRHFPASLPPDHQVLVNANFTTGYYRFTSDLLLLESASPQLQTLPYDSSLTPPPPPPPPLRPAAWSEALQSLPDRDHANFLMRGITRIGIADKKHLQSAKRNLKSAADNPQVISAYLAREVSLGRLCQTCHNPPSPTIHISPCGAIPKKHRPDKWRLIVDLSSPPDHSVNDAIAKELCSVSYASMDQAVAMAQALGRGCLLAKLDLKEAYRAVPVHPSDQRLLAVQWEGATYIDKALPFGLRSAPKLF